MNKGDTHADVDRYNSGGIGVSSKRGAEFFFAGQFSLIGCAGWGGCNLYVTGNLR